MATGRSAFELGTVCAIVLTILALSVATQPRIAVNDGRGYDGSHYYDLAEQFLHGERPSGESRFVRRIGTPLLASWVDADDLVTGFFVVNAVAAVAAALLLYAWLGRYLASTWLRMALVLVHATHWLQLIRFTTFYPVLVDACAQVCCFAGLIGLASYEQQPRHWKIAALALLGGIGVWFREVVLLIPLALLFVQTASANTRSTSFSSWLAQIPRPRLWVPVILAVASLGLLESFVVATDVTFSESDHLVGRAVSRNVLPYVLGWLVAFGPMLAVILVDGRHALDFLRRHRWMLAYVVLVAAVGWAGSLESERHALNWATPVVFVLVGRAIERRVPLRRAPALAMLAVAQLVANRVFWVIPQPSDEPLSVAPSFVLTAVGPHARYLDLFPAYMPRDLAWVQLVQHLGVIAILAWALRARSVSQDAAAIARGIVLVRRRLRATLMSLHAAARGVRHLGVAHILKATGPAFLAGSSVGAAALLVVQPDRPVPIHIRWTEGTQASLRTTLERQWRLFERRRTEGSTWAYLLADATSDRIRDIVRHPSVDDTAHINRRWFRPELKYDRSRQAALFGLLLGGVCAATMLARAAARPGRNPSRSRPGAVAAVHPSQSAAPLGADASADAAPCYPPPESEYRRNQSEALGGDGLRADVGGQRCGSADPDNGTVADA